MNVSEDKTIYEEVKDRARLADETFVTATEARKILGGISRWRLLKIVEEEGLPKPRLVTGRKSKPQYAFLSSELIAWMRNRPQCDLTS